MRDWTVCTAAVVAVTLSACSAGEDPSVTSTSDAVSDEPSEPTATTPTGTDLDDVDGPQLIAALCDAAAADSVEAADGRFQSGAHALLHDLARAVVDVDRKVAARLHETKHAVEAALATGDLTEVEDRLDELTDAARRSLRALDQPTPGCGDGSDG